MATSRPSHFSIGHQPCMYVLSLLLLSPQWPQTIVSRWLLLIGSTLSQIYMTYGFALMISSWFCATAGLQAPAKILCHFAHALYTYVDKSRPNDYVVILFWCGSGQRNL